MRKNIFRMATAALIAAVVAAAPVSAKKAPKREAGKSYELVVLHTNDQHGQVLPTAEGEGGLASQAAFVKQVRAGNKNVLLLSAGDVNIGTALSNMFAAEPDITAYNMMGYDAAAFGNHEFDDTMAKLKQQMKQSKFPWLAANILKGKKPLTKAYIIKDYEGFRVAVIGLTTNRTTVIASPDKSLTFIDEIEAARKAVKEVREKQRADVVIVLGHLGDVLEDPSQNTSIKLAEQVDGIDLIIDGHSHSYFAEPKIVNGTPIVSAHEKGKVVGDAKLTIVDGKVTALDWKPVAINAGAFPPDAAVAAAIKVYEDKAEAALKEVVMHTSAEFEFGAKLPRYKEMPSGDVLADSLVWYLAKTGIKADFAITNGGNIRSPLPAGDVTRENILTMLPFENYVYVVTLKGSDVVKLFDFVGHIRQGAGGWAQVSKEVRYTITYDADGNGTISGVTVGGAPIDPEKTYRIATNDYMAGGGDGYPFAESIDTHNSRALMSEVFIEYVKTLGTVKPETEGRITVIGGTLPE